MKNIYPFLTALLIATAGFAQAPQGFNYQAVARDAAGNLLLNKPIGLQLSILDGLASTAVYIETFSTTTNNLGLFNLVIGTGTPVSGSLSGVNWASGLKFLKTELDPNGGASYTISGTAQLQSVPYALYAASTSPGPWASSGTAILNSNTGGVGIATGGSFPNNSLQIGNPPGFSGNALAIGDGTNGMSFAIINNASTWFTNSNFSLMGAFGGAGNLGIGTASPVNQLQIGSTPGFSGNNIAMGNGAQAMSFFQSPTSSIWYSNTNFSLMPFGGTGNVGISVAPLLTTKLTVQANPVGNGIMVSGASTRTAFEAQTGDFVLDGGNAAISGNLSIGGGDAGSAPLTISGGLYSPTYSGSANKLTNCGGFCGSDPLSIDAGGGDIWAGAFYALSDRRLKHIRGYSDPAKDLKTLAAIRITDYTMKAAGDNSRPYKKVIAQQVEKVYPQIVTASTGFIPNVLQETSGMQRTENGYLLTFKKPHGLSASAKKLQLETSNSTSRCDILSIPSAYQVRIRSAALPAGNVYVYGEQVDDLRKVDYEGLTTLNISATQELNTLVNKQEEKIEQLEKRINKIETFMRTAKHPLQ